MKRYSFFVFCKGVTRANQINAFVLLGIIILMLSHRTLYAQSTIDLSKPVGSPKGSGGASGTGGATYSIPIETLSGTNGLEPSISLNYNSQGGDGNFGWGWSLSSLSAITRAGKSNYYNGTNAPVSWTNTNDAFVLDGQRLFVTSGSNGGSGAVYGTENENFNKIESFGGYETMGPVYFRVTAKNGTVMEYGNAPDARMTADNGQNNNMVWLLNRVTDINGNYEEFHYSVNNADRNFALTEIDYTGNTAQGIQPYNKVKFTYLVKTNWQTQKSFQSGASVTTPFLLSTISVLNSSGINIKQYQCTYSALHNQYFLQSFIETGADGTGLNPLTFSYGSNLAAADVAISPQHPGFTLNNSFTGDITGDGKQDLVVGYYKYDNNGWPYYTNYAVFNDFTQYAGSAGMAQAYNCNITPSSGETQIKTASNYYNFLTFDYDGDSKQDVLRIN